MYAIDVNNGTKVWEWDAWGQMEAATTEAGGHAALPGSLHVHQIIAEWAARTAYVSVSIRVSTLGRRTAQGKLQPQQGVQCQSAGADAAATADVEAAASGLGATETVQGSLQQDPREAGSLSPAAAAAAMMSRRGLGMSSSIATIASAINSGRYDTMLSESSSDSGGGEDSGDDDSGDDDDDDGGNSDDPESEEVGWVWALDLENGSVRWWSGPVGSGISHMVVTETVLLVASRPAENEEGLPELQGINKVRYRGIGCSTFTWLQYSERDMVLPPRVSWYCSKSFQVTKRTAYAQQGGWGRYAWPPWRAATRSIAGAW